MEQQSDMVIQNSSVNHIKGKTHLQWIVACLVNIPLVNCGFEIGWITCVAKLLESDESPTGYPLSATEISWLASTPNLGAMISIPIWAHLVDRYGRKPCIIICIMLQLINWVMKLYFVNMTCLMIARLSGGMASGCCFYAIPMYIKEISQDDIRGTLGMTLNMARSLGILAVYLMGGYLTYSTTLWVVIAVTVASLVAISQAPESPTYYFKTGNVHTAAKTIAFLRKLNVENEDVQKTLDSIKAEDEKFKSIPDVTFVGIFKQKAWCRGFVFMILVMVCHGLNGGLSIVNYAHKMLEMSGVTISPELQSLSIPIFMMVGCLLSMVCIETLGRKLILMMSFLLAMLSFGGLAAVLMVQNQGWQVPAWVPVVLIVIPVCTYAAAVSPIPYVIMTEMFNFHIRAKVMGCLIMVAWTVVFTQIFIFGPITEASGLHITCIFFAIVNFLGTLVVLVLLPETKGKSVEQIETELENTLHRRRRNSVM